MHRGGAIFLPKILVLVRIFAYDRYLLEISDSLDFPTAILLEFVIVLVLVCLSWLYKSSGSQRRRNESWTDSNLKTENRTVQVKYY